VFSWLMVTQLFSPSLTSLVRDSEALAASTYEGKAAAVRVDLAAVWGVEPNKEIELVAFYAPVEETLEYSDNIEFYSYVETDRRCFKSWMDWQSITCTRSRQWELQQYAYTENGHRKVDGMVMVALGTYYLNHGVGDIFNIYLSDGTVFRAIVGDVKDDNHTCDTNRFQRWDGSVVEFIVDRDTLCTTALRLGDLTRSGFNGNVVLIERLDFNWFDLYY
jgi:hypothetical protein